MAKNARQHYERAEELLAIADNAATIGMSPGGGAVVSALAELASAHIAVAVALREGIPRG